MKSIISDLSEPVSLNEFSPTSRLVIQSKLSRGMEFIDLRMWNVWSSDNQEHPNYKNGLFIEKSVLKACIDKIKAYIEA